MKPKTVIFTICDKNNEKWAKGLENSLRKFHFKKEVDFKIYGPEFCEAALKEDQHFWYKATPWIASQLMDEYETVIKIDSDSLVTGNLDHILKQTEYEVGVVLNFNHIDARSYGMYTVWDIKAEEYFNCGLVAMRSKRFVNQWFKLCQSPHFVNYRMREQDLLNILCWYGDYRVRLFDDKETFNGLASKDFWPGAELVDDQLIVKFVDGEGKEVAKKRIAVIHWGGGKDAQKMNFETKFTPEVVKWLKTLAKYE